MTRLSRWETGPPEVAVRPPARSSSSSAREARALLLRIARRHGEKELDFVVERRNAQDASRRDAAAREVHASGRTDEQ
jgi:hypothetical protein